ncbi:glycosyltransferase [Owenweeksia hongkongensis]|uniref:glycosyltransferase n=1 Tax=Owenweeksia hongkongensis TaxID=253245 RepID=UPI003A8E5FE1
MEILFYIWAAVAVYLILHYLFFHSRLLFHKVKQRYFLSPVSIIICAHNEEENLRENLPVLLSQRYGQFEVLLVNDHSTDGTLQLIEELSQKYPNLRILNFTKEKIGRGKKEALIFGIENAAFEHMVFTDADCKPASENWLGSMASYFSYKEIVLGVSPYYFKNNLVGWLTRWETFLTAQQYLSFAKEGMPYMGVGRNMAYTKSVFDRSSKMKAHLKLPSGDDDLLIGEVATASNVAINMNPDAFTYSDAPGTFKDWWQQKRRHLSTSYHYKSRPAVFLGVFGLAQVVFYLLLFPAFFFHGHTLAFYVMLLGKLVLQFITMVPFAIRTRQKGATVLFIVIEPLVVFLLAAIHFQNKIFGNSKDW